MRLDDNVSLEERDFRSHLSRLHRVYRWWGRIAWVRRLVAFFGSPADVAVGLASVGVVAAVTGATVMDAVESRDKIRSADTVATVRHEGSSSIYALLGRDGQGRRVAFDLVILDKRFDWVRASTSTLVEAGGEVLEGPNVASTVFDEAVRRKLASAPQIIAVGAASQEGETAAEAHRAVQRARQTALWTLPLIDSATPVWTLSLGQYREPCTACETAETSWQRPFIVIAARPLDDDADLGEALANAMTGRANLPSPSAYSAFDLTRFR